MGAHAVDRRRVLLGVGALGLLGAKAAIGSAGPMREYPFTLGVASGDPWPDGFVIWTRLAPRPLDPDFGMSAGIHEVRWEIAGNPRFSGRPVIRGKTIARPEWGHSVHVELAGLSANTRYWYRFIVDGHVSTVGTARTAPLAMSDVDRLRIGVAGCQNYEHGYFTAYKFMAEAELDAIFHYGDYIYEMRQGRRTEIPVVREHIGAEPTDLAGYRLRHSLYKTDPDLQRAHSAAPFLMTFDDHEVDNNWAGVHDENGTDPAEFLVRRAAAMQAWYENMPVRSSQRPGGEGLRLHRRLDYGQLLRIHLLDTRQYRDDQICSEDARKNCRPASLVQSGSILGDSQHAWLEEGLDNRFKWNLLAQQVVVMPFDRSGAQRDGTDTPADSWSGYPASRQRLVASLRRKDIANAIIATGDVHQNIVGYLPERDDEPDRNQAAIEFVCTSISSLGDGQDVKIRGPDFRKIIARNPNVFFANGQRGYQVFDIGPRAWRTDIFKVDRVTRRDGQLSRLASFTVEPGSPLAIPS
jgi:alkaline phosphatase D